MGGAGELMILTTLGDARSILAQTQWALFVSQNNRVHRVASTPVIIVSRGLSILMQGGTGAEDSICIMERMSNHRDVEDGHVEPRI